MKKFNFEKITFGFSVTIVILSGAMGVGSFVMKVSHNTNDIDKLNQFVADVPKNYFEKVAGEKLQTELVNFKASYFTDAHAMRDFQFVKTDQNTLYTQLDAEENQMSSQNDRISNLEAKVGFILESLNISVTPNSKAKK